MKKLVVSMLLVLMLVTGCRKVPKLENGQEAVISLDNGAISVDDLYEEMKDRYALNVLIDMMDRKILNDKYESTDEEKTYIENTLTQAQTYYNYYYYKQYSTFESFIQSNYGVSTTDELKDVFALDYKRKQAINDYVKETVTESEINDYYKDKTVGNIKASHILITADYKDGATDEEKKEAENKALETAKEVITKLNNGEDFATLAKKYSKDGSADKGGDVGEFNRGDMVDEFFEAALKLNVGEYTKEPVKTQYGYHIILKTEQKEKPALESVKDEIIEALAKEKLNANSKLSYEALIKTREKAGMTIEDKELKKQYENYVYNVTK